MVIITDKDFGLKLIAKRLGFYSVDRTEIWECREEGEKEPDKVEVGASAREVIGRWMLRYGKSVGIELQVTTDNG